MIHCEKKKNNYTSMFFILKKWNWLTRLELTHITPVNIVSHTFWDTSTSSQVFNCDGVVLEIYLDHKFQWLQEGLNFESLAYEVVT